MFLTFVCAVI